MSALLCSSDAVAALTIVKYDEQPKLFSLIFGEGILNDAVSIVLFKTVLLYTSENESKPLWFVSFLSWDSFHDNPSILASLSNLCFNWTCDRLAWDLYSEAIPFSHSLACPWNGYYFLLRFSLLCDRWGPLIVWNYNSVDLRCCPRSLCLVQSFSSI